MKLTGDAAHSLTVLVSQTSATQRQRDANEPKGGNGRGKAGFAAIIRLRVVEGRSRSQTDRATGPAVKSYCTAGIRQWGPRDRIPPQGFRS